MANPQPDQFTKIANEILEILPRCKFNGTQRGILDIVFRYTYGFQRKSHELSISFFCEAMGMSKSQEKQVRRELNELIELNVLTETDKPTTRTSRKLAFNKDWESWKIEIRSGGLIRPPREDELDHPREDELDHQERNKESIKESIKERASETPEIFFMNNIGNGKISDFIKDSIKDWIDEGVEEAFITRALKEAVTYNALNWNYANKIIKTNFEKGIKTVTEYEQQSLNKKETKTYEDHYRRVE